MAGVIFLTIAEGIIANLASEHLKKISLQFGVKDNIRKLGDTITAIKAVLLDADEKKDTNNRVKVWLDNLEEFKDDADNLVDDFFYEQNRRKLLFGKKKAKKVRIFFSSSNQLVFNRKMAKKIKQIRQTLDEIKSNQVFLQLCNEKSPVSSTLARRETHPFVIDDQVIGREADKRKILELLLDNSTETKESVSIVSLVGIGGLGKTTLAQLVFNDKEFEKNFEKQIWVCVSDSFDLESLFDKIIRSTHETGPDQKLNLVQLQKKVREEIEGKKYLLVLDDVWNEDSEKWDGLERFLQIGARGSRVLITTRSIKVAEISHSREYMLGGLDEHKSWELFERVAFQNINKSTGQYHRLVEIGKDIVVKCKGVPLVINTIGGLLKPKKFSLQNLESEWEAFRDIELRKVAYQNESDRIMATLKLSYNNLPSHLKHCFAYSSLFPKDHRIDVQQLIRLWMAQGFVKADTDRNRQPEEIGYEYFRILYLGCFFQEAETNEMSGAIEYCKMHDLMHDLASLVAGKSVKILDENILREFERNSNSTLSDVDARNAFAKVRHIYVDFPYGSSRLMEFVTGFKSLGSSDHIGLLSNFKLLRAYGNSCQILTLLMEHKKLRTFVVAEFKSLGSSDYIGVLSNFKLLRALSLRVERNTEALPNRLGKLKYLRYLDLSENESIKELPNSITELYNLETLILKNCGSLVSLPSDIQNLTNLRHLEVDGCSSLTHMPRGIGEMTSLQTLDMFVVADDNQSSQTAGLGELSKLKNLHGHLTIKFKSCKVTPMESGAAQYLKDMEHLQWLSIHWETGENAEQVLERLEPSQNIKSIQVHKCYLRKTFPNWLSSLNHLVRLQLRFCWKCKYLPPLHHLSSLQELTLKYLWDLEYVSNWDDISTSSKSLKLMSFFPSLTSLMIDGCSILKEWFRALTEHQQPFFPFLTKLEISNCPLLTSMPLFPNLENLQLYKTSSKPLQQTFMMKLKGDNDGVTAALSASSSTSSSSPTSALSKLKDLSIRLVDDLTSLPEGIGSLSSLTSLRIEECSNLTSLPEGIGSLSSLTSLRIEECSNLTSLPEGIGSLSSLTSLRIVECSNLTSLPEGIDNLPLLTSLTIEGCSNLASLPEGIGGLPSLKYVNRRPRSAIKDPLADYLLKENKN